MTQCNVEPPNITQKFRASTGIQQRIVKTILIWDRPMVTVIQRIDETLRFVFNFAHERHLVVILGPVLEWKNISATACLISSSDSPRLKIVVDKNRFGWKSIRFELVPTGSNFRLLDNQNISSTSHVPANLFPIMSHLHESWFKTHQTDLMFSDSNNRLFNAYLKCSNKKHLKI